MQGTWLRIREHFPLETCPTARMLCNATTLDAMTIMPNKKCEENVEERNSKRKHTERTQIYDVDLNTLLKDATAYIHHHYITLIAVYNFHSSGCGCVCVGIVKA